MNSSSDFRRSSFCGQHGCVEVATSADGAILVRDGKNPTLPSHSFTTQEWEAFVKGVKLGEFDTPRLLKA